MEKRPNPYLVILTPEILGKSFFDHRCYEVLKLWRDRTIQPVTNRPLLLRYLRLLHKLGLRQNQMRWWTWWLTAPGKASYRPYLEPRASSVQELMERLMRKTNAYAIITSDDFEPSPQSARQASWIKATRFLEMIRKGSEQATNTKT